jgi:hypothetical protein
MSYGGEQGNQISQIVNALGGQQGISKALSAYGGQQAAAPPPPANYNTAPRGSYQIPGYNGGPSAATSAAAPPPAAPPAAPGRANYSPNNPFGGIWSNPQADAWEQQSRGGGPPPVPAMPMPSQGMGMGSPQAPIQRAQVAQQRSAQPAPGMAPPLQRSQPAWGVPGGVGSKVMKTTEIDLPPGVENPIVNLPGGGGGGGGSSADVNLPPNGYGAGGPGGYYFSSAPSTLDPGSMRGLLGILGGSNWQGAANQYTQDYKNQYGLQAPGGPRAYWP